MGSATLFLFAFFAFCLAVPAQTTTEEWQTAAMQKYPELGRKGSPFNNRFIQAHDERRKTAPEFFNNPRWPMILADAIAAIGSAESGQAAVIEPSANFLEQKALAEKGDSVAQYRLANLYVNGKEVAQSNNESMRWMRTSAENGYAVAQDCMGMICRDGLGDLPRDLKKSAEWYRKAAEQGLPESEFALWSCYALGEGVTKDDGEASRWLCRAAEHGFGAAQYNLGLRYIEGKGVPRDYVLAYKWENLAGGNGIAQAKKVVDEIEPHLTPTQIAEAQRLTREFKPQMVAKAREPRTPSAPVESEPSASGTGFFITNDGFALTNAHVVKGGAKFQLVTRAGRVAARVVKVDAANDIALLKAEGRFLPLPVTASRSVRLGSTVATVGFPNPGLQGFSPKLGKGEIAALSGIQDDARYFQISVPVQPGNSGGALVDERGNAIGIVSAKLSANAAIATSGALPENVNYAVKGSYLLGFLESVPDVAATIKEPNTRDVKFEEVVKAAEDATVLVLVY